MTNTTFGIDDGQIRPLLAAVAPESDPEYAFALASWTGIAEPGDRVAGVLVAALGAVAALEALVQKTEPADIWSQLDEEGKENTSLNDLTAAFDRWMPRLRSSGAITALRQAARYGAHLVLPDDKSWPTGFSDLREHAPLALWTRGNATLLGHQPAIGIVGARAATGYGEHVTMEFAAGLADRNVTVVSGAAYGIDGMAHRATLASSGKTIAFLAGGVDRSYPSGHDALLTRIVAEGVVASELPCGSPPTKWRFLQRNRLIAALSQATIVIEAGWRSGSLNTAGHAAALGRPLGAVPGPITSAASAGCHRIIHEGIATIVTSVDEAFELLPTTKED